MLTCYRNNEETNNKMHRMRDFNKAAAIQGLFRTREGKGLQQIGRGGKMMEKIVDMRKEWAATGAGGRRDNGSKQRSKGKGRIEKEGG